MNEQRTYLRGESRIGRPRATTTGGISQHLLYFVIAVLPRLRFYTAGLAGLATLLGSAGLCAAGQSGNLGDKRLQPLVTAGIRDPMNPQAYMQELAGRLNPASDKQLLLRGVPQNNGASVNQAGTAAKQGDPRTVPAMPVVAAQAVPAAPTGQKANILAKDDPAAGSFMSFWNDPSLNSPPVQNTGTAAEPIPAQVPAQGNAVQAGPVNPQPAQLVAGESREIILGPLGMALDSMKPGVTLVAQETPANFGAQDGVAQGKGGPQAPKAKWTAGSDLDKYRAHAVKEGSRGSGENVKKAFERAGMTLEDGVNVFVLGYASKRGEPFRKNDGKGLLDEPGKVPQRAGATIGSAGLGLYSVADLILLNSLPDPNATVYADNQPVVRPLVFTGQMIGGVWKTTEEVGNAVTWGYFDNVTGCIGMCIEDILELLKHTGEAVTNLARAPVQLVAGKNEKTERAMDWVLLVPLEFVSNSVEMKGIANMQDYKAAFEDKGVIGSVIELGGSSFLVYRGTKELADKLDEKHHRKCRTQRDSSGNGVTPDSPPDDATPPPPQPDQIFFFDGPWPGSEGSGAVIDGVWTTWRE